MTYQTLDTLADLKSATEGKTVLLRGDLNVPVRDKKITDSTRIKRLVPTIQELRQKGCRVVLISHFGRPNGKVVPDMSLKVLVPEIEAILGIKILFANDCIGDAVSSAINSMPNGGVALLENLRFHDGEEKNDPAFTAALAKIGDIYVNDAFSAAHRAHASTSGLADLLPAAAGRLMQAELEALEVSVGSAARPVTAIVGGAKVSTKLELLNNLVSKVDRLVIGGAMANTFLYSLNNDVGISLCEYDFADTARAVMVRANEEGCEIVLPSDVLIASELSIGVDCESVKVASIPQDKMILDIGTNSARSLALSLKESRTLLWNGPLGAFEVPPFDSATNMVSRAAAALTKSNGLLTVAGGGDTAAALSSAGVLDDFSYVSTAGGAFLEWLEGKELPGISALENK